MVGGITDDLTSSHVIDLQSQQMLKFCRVLAKSRALPILLISSGWEQIAPQISGWKPHTFITSHGLRGSGVAWLGGSDSVFRELGVRLSTRSASPRGPDGLEARSKLTKDFGQDAWGPCRVDSSLGPRMPWRLACSVPGSWERVLKVDVEATL